MPTLFWLERPWHFSALFSSHTFALARQARPRTILAGNPSFVILQIRLLSPPFRPSACATTRLLLVLPIFAYPLLSPILLDWVERLLGRDCQKDGRQRSTFQSLDWVERLLGRSVLFGGLRLRQFQSLDWVERLLGGGRQIVGLVLVFVSIPRLG